MSEQKIKQSKCKNIRKADFRLNKVYISYKRIEYKTYHCRKEVSMAIIKNPIPNLTIRELKEVYKNRKSNHLEEDSWKKFIKKYKAAI